MTPSINSSKRSYDESNNPPKRRKSEEEMMTNAMTLDKELPMPVNQPFESFCHFLHNEENLLQRHFTYLDLGALLSVSKSVRAFAQHFFEKKAATHAFPFKTSAAGIKHLENLNWDEVVEHLTDPKAYTEPNRFILPLLGACKNWQKTDPQEHVFNCRLQSNEAKALSLASYYQRTKIVKLFLDHVVTPVTFSDLTACPHPETQDMRLPSPLHLSILRGDLQTVAVHLDHGVYLMEIDYCLQFKSMYGFSYGEIAIGLFECALGGRKALQLMEKATINFPMVDFLLERGLKPQSSDLIGAAESCSIDAMALLIANGAELDQETATEALVSLLDMIMDKNPSHLDEPTRKMIEFLIEKQADLHDTTNHCDYAPLELAVMSKCLEVVRVLLEHKADPLFKRNESEDSSLDLARKNGLTEIEALLFSNPLVE